MHLSANLITRHKNKSFSLAELKQNAFTKTRKYWDICILFSFLIKHNGNLSWNPLHSISLKLVTHWLLIVSHNGKVFSGVWGRNCCSAANDTVCVQIYILITPVGLQTHIHFCYTAYMKQLWINQVFVMQKGSYWVFLGKIFLWNRAPTTHYKWNGNEFLI